MSDTPATNSNLAATLSRAAVHAQAAQRGALLPLAQTVDQQRGRVVPDGTRLGPGETPSTDLAEGLQLLALRLRREVYGASRSAGRE